MARQDGSSSDPTGYLATEMPHVLRNALKCTRGTPSGGIAITDQLVELWEDHNNWETAAPSLLSSLPPRLVVRSPAPRQPVFLFSSCPRACWGPPKLCCSCSSLLAPSPCRNESRGENRTGGQSFCKHHTHWIMLQEREGAGTDRLCVLESLSVCELPREVQGDRVAPATLKKKGVY